MADIDLSEIIEDPDLSDLFDVIRRTETVSASNGRSTITEEPAILGVVGVVTPGDSGDMLRKDDSAMTSNVITVSTLFRLRAVTDGVQPDIVVYDGIRYTVRAVKRWTRLGAGFVKAACVSEQAFDPSPT